VARCHVFVPTGGALTSLAQNGETEFTHTVCAPQGLCGPCRSVRFGNRLDLLKTLSSASTLAGALAQRAQQQQELMLTSAAARAAVGMTADGGGALGPGHLLLVPPCLRALLRGRRPKTACAPCLRSKIARFRSIGSPDSMDWDT
jgi:hypothetical protein